MIVVHSRWLWGSIWLWYTWFAFDSILLHQSWSTIHRQYNWLFGEYFWCFGANQKQLANNGFHFGYESIALFWFKINNTENWNKTFLLSSPAGTIVSIAFFNYAGISVTKEISATTRMVHLKKAFWIYFAISFDINICVYILGFGFSSNYGDLGILIGNWLAKIPRFTAEWICLPPVWYVPLQRCLGLPNVSTYSWYVHSPTLWKCG